MRSVALKAKTMPVYSSRLIADIARIGSRQEVKGAWRREKGAEGMGQGAFLPTSEPVELC